MKFQIDLRSDSQGSSTKPGTREKDRGRKGESAEPLRQNLDVK